MSQGAKSHSLVVDLRSQSLCLKDALASASDDALVHAVEAVARARGLSQLAAEAGVDRAGLAHMLAAAGRADMAALRAVVAELIACWDQASQNDPSGNAEKDDLESEKT